jgi:hypothetical protein
MHAAPKNRPTGAQRQTAGGATISKHTYTLDALGNRTQFQEDQPQFAAAAPDFAGYLLAAWPAPAGGLRAAAADQAAGTPPPTASPSATATATSTTTAPATTTATGTAAATPTRPAAAARPKPAGLEPLPLDDVSADEPYLYRAAPRGHVVELFERGRPAANARVRHVQTGTSIAFELLSAAGVAVSVVDVPAAQQRQHPPDGAPPVI